MANMRNPNRNCLEGMRCPNCECYGPFQIEVSAVVLMHDDGSETIGTETDFDMNSWIRCPNCDRDGLVKEFSEPEVVCY